MNIFSIFGRKAGFLKIVDLLKFPQFLQEIGVNMNASTLPPDAEGFLVSDGSGTQEFSTTVSFSDTAVIEAATDLKIRSAGELNLFGDSGANVFVQTSGTVYIGDTDGEGNEVKIEVDDPNFRVNIEAGVASLEVDGDNSLLAATVGTTTLTIDGNDGTIILDANEVIRLASQNQIHLIAADEIILETTTQVVLGDDSTNANGTRFVLDDTVQTVTITQSGATPATSVLVVEQTASLPSGVTLKLADNSPFGNPSGHGISFERAAAEEALVVNTATGLSIQTSGSRSVEVAPGGALQFTTIQTFANNAAAVTGGLGVGSVYKTATGELRIVV